MSISELITDQELVEKLHNNDIDAFDQIFKRYSDRLYGFTFKYLKNNLTYKDEIPYSLYNF